MYKTKLILNKGTAEEVLYETSIFLKDPKLNQKQDQENSIGTKKKCILFPE